MSFLKTNYSNTQSNDYSPLPEGEYEMLINKVQEQATPSGSESLQIDLLVRTDLDGVQELKDTNAKYHKRHVFMDNWKRKATKQYDLDGLQYILQAIDIPEGTDINSVDDFMKLITGFAVRVFVKVGHDDYNDRDRNEVAPWNFSKTKYPLDKQIDVAPSFDESQLPF